MVSGVTLFFALFNNLAIFIAMVAVYGTVTYRSTRHQGATRQLLLGLAFGLFALGCMHAKIPVATGVRVDQRNAIVALSGAFGGPLSAVLTGACAAAYRTYLGGSGVVSGVTGITLSAIAGMILHQVKLPFSTLRRGALAALGATAIILPGFALVGSWREGLALMFAMTIPYGTAITLAIFFGGMLLYRVDLQREAELRFRQMVEVSPEAIIVVDKSRKIRLYNAQAETYSGIRADLIVGRSFEELTWLGAEAQTELDKRCNREEDTATPVPVELRTEEGEHVLEVMFVPVFSANGEREWMISIRDVTARKRAEEARADYEARIQKSKSLEALGRLAGGVAHDFNNMLTVILGTSDIIIATEKTNEPLRTDLESIHTAATKAAELTAQLLAFGRKQVLEPQVVSLNDVIFGLIPLLKRSLPESIELIVDCTPGIANVSVDAAQLDQVLVNLVVNARDAMPQGGKLRISTKERDFDDAYAAGTPEVAPGRYVEISVCDTGTGMSAEVLARIFEPFYTTKAPGKGTGLGLATVHGIIRQSGGHIQAQSEVGKGSCFCVYLPKTTQNITTESPPPTGSPQLSGHVLLVEDNDLVRVPIRRMLHALGFLVTEADGGKEALAAYVEAKPPIDLLVTDVIMRDTSGTLVAAELQKLNPTLKVLFMSGYTENAIVRNGAMIPGTNFIAKPFTIDKLGAALLHVLADNRNNTAPNR
jgi:PAS domain S-box-containing protein